MPDRVTVHGGVVVAGDVDGRGDVGGQDTAQRAADRQLFDGGDGGEDGPDVRPGLVHRHRIRIVVVGGGDVAQCAHWGRAGWNGFDGGDYGGHALKLGAGGVTPP